MKLLYSLLITLFFCATLQAQTTSGFRHSYVTLDANSTGNQDYYIIPDPVNNTFPAMGGWPEELLSLTLKGTRIKTWETDGDAVLRARFDYRITTAIFTGPGSLKSGSVTLLVVDSTATGEKRWATGPLNIDMAEGLPPGDYIFYASHTLENREGFDFAQRLDYSGEQPDEVRFTVVSPLPVSLISFTANATNNRMARLDWATATETNNAHFEVERSTDAQTFVRLGRVAGQGTTTARRTYQFTDEAPASGVNYYRLKQVDQAGTFSYSPLRAVTLRTNGELLVLGNPAAEQVRVAGLEPGTSLELTDLTGQVRARQTATQTEASVDVRHLPNGTYLLRVAEPTGTQTRRVLVNR